jgi:hypothetical protein
MSQEEPALSREYDFARGQHFMDAIRSSGYENAAMAVGELVDNSIQAGAENVDILVSEKRVQATKRRVRRIQEIAVLDDGEGMSPDLLRRALKMGDGTHFDEQGGIGKFGVGLPQASVSQAKRVDVWSWQDGIENAHHTLIDLDDVEWVEHMIIPEPKERPIPEKWREMTNNFDEESGTLVVWSKVDRCTWKKAKTLYRHSENLIGRMYRNWLHPDTDKRDVDISLLVYSEDNDEVDDSWEFRPNDPLYLMENTNVDLPDGVPDPPFEQYGETTDRTYNVEQSDGEVTEEIVEITFSVTKPETRRKVDGRPAGHASHGKHAKENMGLSIVREGRELNLDKNWVPSKEPQHRWWGAQIEFGRNMDNIFGVTNNKQRADRLSGVANTDWDDFAEEGESVQEIRDRLEQEDFPTYVCLDVKDFINDRIRNQLFKKVQELGQYTSEDTTEEEKRHEDSPERQATEATKDRKETGKIGESDEEEEELSKEEQEEQIRSQLEDRGYDDVTVNEVTGEVVDLGLKYSFIDRPLGSEIFSVEPASGAILIGLNTDHVAYDELFSSLDLEDEEELDEAEAAEKLRDANQSLKLLLEAWARMEDEARDERRDEFKDIREDWGRVARDFLNRRNLDG